ncbi:hypothetical protein X777_12234, partial [Ooceraea biroi]
MRRKRHRRERRWWVRSINKTRNELGYFNNQFKEAYETDHEEFFHMTWMTPAQYDHLCNLVRPFFTKKSSLPMVIVLDQNHGNSELVDQLHIKLFLRPAMQSGKLFVP